MGRFIGFGGGSGTVFGSVFFGKNAVAFARDDRSATIGPGVGSGTGLRASPFFGEGTFTILPYFPIASLVFCGSPSRVHR
jgi:hypothetical protein